LTTGQNVLKKAGPKGPGLDPKRMRHNASRASSLEKVPSRPQRSATGGAWELSRSHRKCVVVPQQLRVESMQQALFPLACVH
jgi:hypothetical protein